MKRRLVYAFLAAVFAFMPLFASAQSNTVTGSGFQVQNLSDSQAATITVIYYSEATQAEAARTSNVNVPAGGSVTFLNGTNGTLPIDAPTGFRGSVVIESNIPVAAITNLVGNSIGSSYSGFTTGSQRVLLPLITRANFGVSTSLNIQNTGTQSASVTVTYTPGVAGATGQTDTATIAPGASRTFSQADKTSLGTRFVGSAVVTSVGGSVAVVVQQEGNTQLLSYDGFNNGATTVNVPLIAANNFGNLTGLQVQNAGTASANVVIDFAANTIPAGAGVCGEPADKTVTLAAGASATFIQAGGNVSEGFDPFFATCRYVGAATIRNASGGTQPLVAIVNQVLTGAKNASAYESFDPAVATASNKAPLVFANNFNLFSGVQVQNAGAAAVNVTINYGTNTITGTGACPAQPASKSRTINPGDSFTFIQAGGTGDAFDSQFATCRYVGAATITAPAGSKIVSIVNQANKQPSNTTDTLFTYNAFNQ